jgi:hypothetical protein
MGCCGEGPPSPPPSPTHTCLLRRRLPRCAWCCKLWSRWSRTYRRWTRPAAAASGQAK